MRRFQRFLNLDMDGHSLRHADVDWPLQEDRKIADIIFRPDTGEVIIKRVDDQEAEA